MFDFNHILNMLARASGKEGTPTPSAQDSYQYFWGDHPEKNKTAMARYDAFGGQQEPLGGEIGRESSGVQLGGQEYFPPMPDGVSRLPDKFRQKYMTMLGQMRPNFDQGSWR